MLVLCETQNPVIFEKIEVTNIKQVYIMRLNYISYGQLPLGTLQHLLNVEGLLWIILTLGIQVTIQYHFSMTVRIETTSNDE